MCPNCSLTASCSVTDRSRPWLAAAGVLAVLAAAAGSCLGWAATRVYGSLRWLPPLEAPEHVARAVGARFRDAGIAAADGAPLRAWVLERPNARGAAIVLHGAGSSRYHLLGHGAMLARNGYSVILPDNRGHGASGGDWFSYGVRERDDVSRWLDWALSNLGAVPLFGLGESMGASILLQSLGYERRFSAIVAESPFSSFAAIASERVPVWPVVQFGFLTVRWRLGVDLASADAIEPVRATSTPVLLIHSAADRNVSLRHSRLLRDANPAKVRLWEPEAVEHTQAMAVLPEEFERRVTGWFTAANAGAVR